MSRESSATQNAAGVNVVAAMTIRAFRARDGWVARRGASRGGASLRCALPRRGRVPGGKKRGARSGDRQQAEVLFARRLSGRQRQPPRAARGERVLPALRL